MNLIVLGSGTILSGIDRNPSGYLLNDGQNQFLIDSGPGILRQLKRLDFDVLRLRACFISHFHLDHWADLFPLLMNRYLLKKDTNESFRIFGPPGIENLCRRVVQTQGDWLRGHLPHVIVCDPNKTITFGRLQITSFATQHTEESVAYRFNGEGSLFYSSDTPFDPKLAEFARDADIGIVECSHPDAEAQGGHMSPSTTGRFASAAGLKRLVATHIYPGNDNADLQPGIARHFEGRFTIAEDFAEFQIP